MTARDQSERALVGLLGLAVVTGAPPARAAARTAGASPGHRGRTDVAAVMLVALGSDYNVFLTGRIWQEARKRPLREAVAVGGSRAASAITGAGIVLALSFELLALVPIRPFRELAFAMSCGLLIDAFVVRTLFVPALITLVGPVSVWPRRRLGAERDAATRDAARTGAGGSTRRWAASAPGLRGGGHGGAGRPDLERPSQGSTSPRRTA